MVIGAGLGRHGGGHLEDAPGQIARVHIDAQQSWRCRVGRWRGLRKCRRGRQRETTDIARARSSSGSFQQRESSDARPVRLPGPMAKGHGRCAHPPCQRRCEPRFAPTRISSVRTHTGSGGPHPCKHPSALSRPGAGAVSFGSANTIDSGSPPPARPRPLAPSSARRRQYAIDQHLCVPKPGGHADVLLGLPPMAGSISCAPSIRYDSTPSRRATRSDGWSWSCSRTDHQHQVAALGQVAHSILAFCVA